MAESPQKARQPVAGKAPGSLTRRLALAVVRGGLAAAQGLASLLAQLLMSLLRQHQLVTGPLARTAGALTAALRAVLATGPARALLGLAAGLAYLRIQCHKRPAEVNVHSQVSLLWGALK
jgi:hypothetical protein